MFGQGLAGSVDEDDRHCSGLVPSASAISWIE